MTTELVHDPSTLTKRDMLSLETEELMWDLRKRGYSLREIAAQAGCSHVHVRNVIDRRITELVLPKVEEYRKFEDARLDELLKALEPKLQKGEVPAVLAALKICERRARLLGLDKDPKFQFSMGSDSPFNQVFAAVMVSVEGKSDYVNGTVLYEDGLIRGIERSGGADD